MEKYTIYCTEAQTKKALELGAPIETDNNPLFSDGIQVTDSLYAKAVTAEQMINWLEEQHSLQFLTGVDDEDKFFFNVYHTEGYIEVRGCKSRKEATLAAIDAALEYLIENNK